MALETVSEGHSLIIFCPTKRNCEQVAEQIAREFYNIGNPESELSPEVGEALRRQLNGVHISDVLTQLSQCPGGVDEVLAKCIAFGIAFHHAGKYYKNSHSHIKCQEFFLRHNFILTNRVNVR